MPACSARSATVLPTELARALLVQLGELALDLRIKRGAGNQGLAGHIVDHLNVDVVQAAIHAQTRHFGRAADLLTHTLMTDLTDLITITFW